MTMQYLSFALSHWFVQILCVTDRFILRCMQTGLNSQETRLCLVRHSLVELPTQVSMPGHVSAEARGPSTCEYLAGRVVSHRRRQQSSARDMGLPVDGGHVLGRCRVHRNGLSCSYTRSPPPSDLLVLMEHTAGPRKYFRHFVHN
jgi:hypothetical protein